MDVVKSSSNDDNIFRRRENAIEQDIHNPGGDFPVRDFL
jgi:hypothetical protein